MSSFILRQAKVVDSNLEDSYNPLIIVRIAPEFTDAKASECPVFSPFFSNKCGKFASEKDGNAETVWVLTAQDYSEGYVLGRVGKLNSNSIEDVFTYGELFDFNKFKNLLTELQTQGVAFDGFKETEIEVDLYTTTDHKQGSIICHNIKTGDLFIFNSAGGVMVLTPLCFGVMVGKSKFTITNESTVLTSKQFIVNAEHISFGKEGLRLLGTSEEIGDAVLGSNLIPSSVCSM